MIRDKHTIKKTAVKPGKSKRRVFIIDDQPIICKGLEQLIGHEPDLTVCGISSDISTALKEIKGCKPDISVVDISLGDMSGIRLLEELISGYKELPIMVLSAYSESLYAERCLRAGARGYIMKTEPFEEILSSIRAVLNGAIYVSENMRNAFLNKLTAGQGNPYEPDIAHLSNRELEVFQLIGTGLRTQHIAAKLNLSLKTIETYIEHIKKKMHLKSYHDVLIYAIRWTLVESRTHGAKKK